MMKKKTISGATMFLVLIITLLAMIGGINYLIEYDIRVENYYQQILTETTKTALRNNIRFYIVNQRDLIPNNEWVKIKLNFDCFVRVSKNNEIIYVDFKVDRLPNCYIRGEVLTYYDKNVKYYRLVKWYWIEEEV